MMYPKEFAPSSTETFVFQEQSIDIPKCSVLFEKRAGIPVKETFGGKPTLQSEGKPVFAEIAIMNVFRRDGWETRWVETYGKKEPIRLTEWIDSKYRDQVHRPFEDKTITDILDGIAALNKSYAGCWDVVAKKDEYFLFAESKRRKKDRIRPTQINWLFAALSFGLKAENFLMVEWDYT